jgi:hypothetical protein
MKVVIALGGNALLERGEAPDSDIQERHVVSAVTALAPLARRHQLFITHGNGPQVGVLAVESARDPALSHPYPFDVLGAQTQGMIGYWLVQALQGAVPSQPAGCLLGRTLVRPDDPAFASPTKFVGPVYDAEQARQLAPARAGPSRQRGPHVPGRLHGPESGSRLPVRGGDGRDGRDRPARRRRGTPGRQGRHDRGARLLSATGRGSGEALPGRVSLRR